MSKGHTEIPSLVEFIGAGGVKASLSFHTPIALADNHFLAVYEQGRCGGSLCCEFFLEMIDGVQGAR